MPWADRFSSRAPAARRPRLSFDRLEDRAVPNGAAADAPGYDHPADPLPEVEIVKPDLPPDEGTTPAGDGGSPTPGDEVIQELHPTDGVVAPNGEVIDLGQPTDGVVEPGDPKPDPVGEVIGGTDPDWVKRTDEETGTPSPTDEVVEPGDPKPDPVEGTDPELPPTDPEYPVPELPPGDEVIYYTMGPPAPTPRHDGHDHTPAPVASLWVGDRVWRDTDGNGRQDVGEWGIGGVSVQLFRGDTLVGSTATAADGGYLFTPANVPNGTPTDPADDGLYAHTAYQVRIALAQPALAGLRATRTDRGDDAGDSDAVAATGSAVIVLTTGAAGSVTRSDVGFAPTAGIGNGVWNDANNNGRWDTGETGLGGVAVRLLDGTTEVAATTTAADGSYHFADLLPGTYVVEVAATNFATSGALTGWMSSTGRSGSATGPYEGGVAPRDGFDGGSTANGVVRSASVAAGGAAAQGVDFGFVKVAGGISGKVFRDRNGDGQIDRLNAEERTGLAGVVIRASGPGGTLYATTDATGAYSFPNLPVGSYALTQVKQPQGFASTTPNTLLVPVADSPVTVNFGEQARADLKVSQSVSQWVVRVGDEVRVTFKVKNRGAADATDVKVRTACGKGFQMVGMGAGERGAYDPATGLWTVGTLAAGESATCTVRLKVKGSAALDLSARGLTSAKEDVVTNNKATMQLKVKPKPGVRALWMTGGR